MSDCLVPIDLSSHRLGYGLEVAGCRVDLAMEVGAVEASATAVAARLAEELVSAHLGCERPLVRVAGLMPSGRPIAMVQGRAASVCVSVSHGGGLVVAVACRAAGVGVDIVDPADAGPGLDIWFTPDERLLLPDEEGLLRARLWAAKEAAFKAARLDERFHPRAVRIHDLRRTTFAWSVRGDHRCVEGQGTFAVAGSHLVAVAVATGGGDAATASRESFASENAART